MKKTLLVLVTLTTLLIGVLSFFPGAVSPALARPFTGAHTARPLTNHLCDDSGALQGCFSIGTWSSISTNGAASTITVDNPNFTGLDQYNKYIRAVTANGSYALVGMGRAADVCGTGNLYWFTETGDAGGNNPIQCHGTVNSSDDNQDVTLTVVEYSGGVDFYINAHVDNPCNPCQASDTQFNHAFTASDQEAEFAVSNGFTGHAVWGGHWIDNQYHEGLPGSWAYDNSTSSFSQTVNDNGSLINGNTPPPQMLWNSVPNGNNNNGGTLYSCEYDNPANSCTFGS